MCESESLAASGSEEVECESALEHSGRPLRIERQENFDEVP